jgi:hypothetical protein
MTNVSSVACRFAVALLYATAAFADARAVPPESGPDEITVPSTVTEDHVRHVRLGKRVAEFELTRLDELRDWTGAGTIERDGDAGTSRTWLCYSLPEQLVWFISTEMGGGSALMEVFGEAVSSKDPRIATCPRLPESLRPIAFDFGWVGSSEKAFRAVLGQPSGVRGEWSQYFYLARTQAGSATSGGSESVGAFIEAKFRNGKAVAVRASHVTSD